MRRTIFAGLIVAVVAWVLTGTDVFGTELTQTALLGVAVGAVLALAPYERETLAARAIAWGLGLLAAWAGYALWAAVLPDTGGGRAAGAVLVVLVLTVVAAGSQGRFPLWALLLGVVSLVGAYETTFTAQPTAFVGDSATAATRVALATALAFCVVALVVHPVDPGRPDPVPGLDENEAAVVPHHLLGGDAEVPRAREATTDDPARYRSES